MTSTNIEIFINTLEGIFGNEFNWYYNMLDGVYYEIGRVISSSYEKRIIIYTTNREWNTLRYQAIKRYISSITQGFHQEVDEYHDEFYTSIYYDYKIDLYID